MSMPFYVPPEQLVKDRAEFARKGIARGRSLVAMTYNGGVLIVAENTSRTLHKISEIYDRIAFASVGKYNEFELLRVAGIRHADLKGYMYSRQDVLGKSLANAFAQTLGNIFTHEVKPYEIELMLCELGNENQEHRFFRILYDGTLYDEINFCAIGGQAEELTESLENGWTESMSLSAALALGVSAFGGEASDDRWEVAVLEAESDRRAFRRLDPAEATDLMS
jgi:proteasome alpha subunit